VISMVAQQSPQMVQGLLQRMPNLVPRLLALPAVQEEVAKMLGEVCVAGGYALPPGQPTWTPAQVPGAAPQPPSLPPPNNGDGGCANGMCGIPKPNVPKQDCGCHGGGGNGGGNLPAVPNDWSPKDACGLPPLSPTTQQQLGQWNCIAVRPDLAPCDVQRIMREEKLPTVIGTIAGPFAINREIAVEFAPIGVSHDICIDHIKVEFTNAADPAETVTVEIPAIWLQPELLTKDPKGIFDHNWDYADPERPEYLGITDGRCRCETLCVCASAYAHARLVFQLPIEVPVDTSVKITVWGRRRNWMRVCGPCPPCDVCEREALTNAEEVAGVDQVYLIPV
jgi:hypothetical protein